MLRIDSDSVQGRHAVLGRFAFAFEATDCPDQNSQVISTHVERNSMHLFLANPMELRSTCASMTSSSCAHLPYPFCRKGNLALLRVPGGGFAGAKGSEAMLHAQCRGGGEQSMTRMSVGEGRKHNKGHGCER